MKKKVLFLFALLLPMMVRAFDFQVVVPSGQTLYFDTVPGGVAVVRPNGSAGYTGAWNGYVKPTGALIIPSEVVWQGTTRQVLSVEPAAFYGCNYLTSVVIEHGITSLGNSAFYDCNNMVSVTIPASVVSIGSQTFSSCTSLADVWMYAVVPPVTASGAFYNLSLSSCTLHVPCQSAADYQAATPWSNFGSVVAMPCSSTVSTAVNNPFRGHVTGAGTYPYGTLVTLEALPEDGFAFICWNDGDTLNPRLVEATSDTAFVAMFFALIHDTTILEIHDTAYVHDTTILYDTVDLTPQFFQLRVLSDNDNLGLGVGSAVLPEGTEAEVCALPLEGARFTGWDDGAMANPRRVMVDGNRTLTALFERVGVTSPEFGKWNVAVNGLTMEVACPQGLTVTVYDVGGRVVTSAPAAAAPLRFSLPVAGTYVLSVDGLGARKVIVE